MLLENVLMKREVLQISLVWASRAVQSSRLPEVMSTSASRTRGWGLPRGAFLGIRRISAPRGEDLDPPRAGFRLNLCCEEEDAGSQGLGFSPADCPLCAECLLGLRCLSVSF